MAKAHTSGLNFAMENTLDIDNLDLTTLEMLYHMHHLEGVAVVGDPAHAFATYDANKKALYIYAESPDSVHMVAHQTDSLFWVLKSVQEEGASFNVCGDKVICVVSDVVAEGASYAEAALRAILKYKLMHSQDAWKA